MKYTIFSLAILLFFSSCSNNSKSDLVVFEATTHSLEQSSKTINEITTDYRKELFERLNDPKTAEQAAVWQPRAVRISELTSLTIGYINKLKSQLVGENDNFQVVNKIFFQQNKGEELYQRLKDFIDSIHKSELLVDIYLAELIKDKYDYLDSNRYDQKEFCQIFFNKISIAAALSLLAKFENDIRNIEKEIITSCYYRTIPGYWHYDAFQTLIAQSSNCVKAGDNIEITAGVGSFSVAAQPKFTIDGTLIPVDENGIAVYKFKTPSKAGKYIKPLKMEYTKPDGTKESMTRNIEYTVIEEQ